MPHHVEVIKILNEGIADNENIVVKNKTKLEGLGVDQKPDQDEGKAS
jgi:hypothetical protein